MIVERSRRCGNAAASTILVAILSIEACYFLTLAAPTHDTTYFIDTNSSTKVLVINGSKLVIPLSFDDLNLDPNADTNTSNITNNNTSPTNGFRSLELRNAELDIVADDSSHDVLLNYTQTSLRSNKQQVLDIFDKFFTKARSHDDQQQKEIVRDGVIFHMRKLGYETSFLQKSRFEFRKLPAYSYNMISILPGKHRHTKNEKIVLIGAHWDSATKAPGVDDNGSGSACLLEIARILSENRCNFNHTIMLVWFDYEEQGKFGSEFFVNDYLFPHELEKYGSKFIGAYIMDMILVRDKENFTQQIPSHLGARLPDFQAEMERDKYRGDFLATWARHTWDEPLESAFRSAWTDLGFESRTFKAMRPVLPRHRLPSSNEKVHWSDFFRSDHASFWFPALTTKTVHRAPNRTSTAGHTSLNAILLTDLGPWRKSYAQCYHSACDDSHFLTDGNLAFMQQVVDTLVLTLMRIAQGECKGLRGPMPISSLVPIKLTVAASTAITASPSTETSTSTTTTPVQQNEVVSIATSSPMLPPSPTSTLTTLTPELMTSTSTTTTTNTTTSPKNI